ncbi:maleylpyruvate isomerase family mycothiol-dependent enzyme [Actinoplanes sp. TFC3]|uniref:maleylpyruvate isomerase family mycothiol-dependent enzyme n=1 Tax=Actinoplanes sp. TFC3 TaxID=1710355 RepID=UPI00137B670A|nr:maleylpyruvate isomerase family mycothiol-dependent enzyme [Actinoplanes sp. TFC3]
MPMITAERLRVADFIEGLDQRQLQTPSLCMQWTVKQVAAHLISPFAIKAGWYLPAMVKSRFNLHRAFAILAARIAERPVADIAAVLRENAETPYRAPRVGFLGQLTDLQVHGQDMRRPLGVAAELKPEALQASLEFLAGKQSNGLFVAKGLRDGLRFEATDLGWSTGSGALVQGPAEAVMLALTGRPAALAELTGDGASLLRQRIVRRAA